MNGASSNTLRLLMPQWQGGNNEAYSLGAKLLAWLAPQSSAPLVEVPVTPFKGDTPLIEGGILWKSVLLEQQQAARQIIEKFKPNKIIVFGGDCLVSQAPFAYLNEYYDGNIGVLWIDAHPDVSTPNVFNREHAMVLGNLLGEGDADFAKQIKRPIKPHHVMYAGLQETTEQETEVINRLGLHQVSTEQLIDDSQPILKWIADNNIKHIAIHLDLDVLDPTLFRSLLFANPTAISPIDAPYGKMSLTALTRLIKDVEKQTNVVGLSIAEHTPWDAINLKQMMEQFAFMKE